MYKKLQANKLACCFTFYTLCRESLSIFNSGTTKVSIF